MRVTISSPIVENQMEKKMENEMETVILWGLGLGLLLAGPHNEDSSFGGSILGSPCFGKVPFRA